MSCPDRVGGSIASLNLERLRSIAYAVCSTFINSLVKLPTITPLDLLLGHLLAYLDDDRTVPGVYGKYTEGTIRYETATPTSTA